MIVVCTHRYLNTSKTFESLDSVFKYYSLKREDFIKTNMEYMNGYIIQKFYYSCYVIECKESIDTIFNYIETHLLPIVTTKDWFGSRVLYYNEPDKLALRI